MVRRNQKSESRKQKCVARAFLLSAFCLLLSAAAAASSLSVDKRTLALDDSLTIVLTLDDTFSEAEVGRLPLQNLDQDCAPNVATSFEWINGVASHRKALTDAAHPTAAPPAMVGALHLQ